MPAQNNLTISRILQRECAPPSRQLVHIQHMWNLFPGCERPDRESLLELSLGDVRSSTHLSMLIAEARTMRDEYITRARDLPAIRMPTGRFLVTEVDQVVEDGHAHHDSSCNLSSLNTPRPVLWVTNIELSLVSWIPQELADDIDIAVMCNAEQSIHWVDVVL